MQTEQKSLVLLLFEILLRQSFLQITLQSTEERAHESRKFSTLPTTADNCLSLSFEFESDVLRS